MKLVIVLLMSFFSFNLFANQDFQETFNQVTVEVDGEKITLQVDQDTALELIESFSMETACRPVPGGWRKCYVASGLCFGKTYPNKAQCDIAL